MALWPNLSGLRGRRAKKVDPPSVPTTLGRVHTLEDNYHLTSNQHASCVALIGQIQQLYEGASAYADSWGIDRALILPGNEWADLVPSSGIAFRTGYRDINYLRLHAPFAGYHLLILDRLDPPQFDSEWTDEFVATTSREGLPEDIVQLLKDRVDARERLLPLVGEYVEHIRNVPDRYVVRTPRLFSEIGIEVNGILINSDVVLCQSRINALLCSGVLAKLDADIARRGRARVLEVGPGYGSLAYALKGIFGERLEYIVVDLPSSIYYASIYLSVLSNRDRCHLLMPGEKLPASFDFLFVANYLLDELGGDLGPIDLAVNTMSFPEMSEAQVRHYALAFKRLLRDDGVVYDENAAIKPHHTDSKAILSEVFPFRKRIASSIVTTKDWCQDVWSSQYLGAVFDRSDAMLLR